MRFSGAAAQYENQNIKSKNIQTKGEVLWRTAFSENEYVYAFRDIAPCAPVHVLVVPKKHISSAMQLTQKDDALLGKIFEAVNEVARICGVDKSGYRVVTNVGRDAGQSVLHLHFHVLGGRPFMNDMSTPNAGCEEH